MSSDPIKPHHLLWLQAAVQASHRSPRVDNKNGAVIVDTRGTILSTDHNIPRFKDNFERRALYAAHPTWQKNAPCAEARAILAAQQKGLDLTHGTLVTLWHPCASVCLGPIQRAGIRTIIHLVCDKGTPLMPDVWPDLSARTRHDVTKGWKKSKNLVHRGTLTIMPIPVSSVAHLLSLPTHGGGHTHTAGCAHSSRL